MARWHVYENEPEEGLPIAYITATLGVMLQLPALMGRSGTKELSVGTHG